MAGRRGPRPAKDRLAAAQFAADTAAGLIRVHRKVCAPCDRFAGHPAGLCDEGYELLRAETRATRRVERIEREIDLAGRQGVLFG